MSKKFSANCGCYVYVGGMAHEDKIGWCDKHGFASREELLMKIIIDQDEKLSTDSWISTKDRLPEPNKDCFVIEPDGTMTIAWLCHLYDRWTSVDCDFVEATHWRQLPEGPKQ